jgi:hypothetical protein
MRPFKLQWPKAVGDEHPRLDFTARRSERRPSAIL